ncbi:MAG TPA: hypothetical protein VGR43_00030 [Dehalococcoidia bacterium]|nr:hypothetical protein [Dehalococcoidia bacterium]
MFNPGPGDPPNTNQVHDFNPGIRESGLFWTAPIDRASAEFRGRSAALLVSDQEMPDYFTFENALTNAIPPPPGVVSYDVRWTPGGRPVRVVNDDLPLAATFARGTATIEWQGRAGDWEFVSDPASTSASLYAEYGRERNGVFA